MIKDDELNGLYEVIYAGEYFHTWPGRDENQDALHDACLRLERLGRLKRHIDNQNHVCWRPVKNDILSQAQPHTDQDRQHR